MEPKITTYPRPACKIGISDAKYEIAAPMAPLREDTVKVRTLARATMTATNSRALVVASIGCHSMTHSRSFHPNKPIHREALERSCGNRTYSETPYQKSQRQE